MANDMLKRYGLKEVADVTFYKANDDGTPGVPVLVLDSLKVSTIEQTAEQAEARGGKGNTKLIVWDYGKEITLTIEDALFSPKSFELMFGCDTATTTNSVNRTKRVVATTTMTSATQFDFDGLKVDASGVTFYDAAGASVSQTDLVANTVYQAQWSQTVQNATTYVIKPDSFPGTYYIQGDTYVRNEKGEDKYFQFVIPKAKIQAEQTLTMEAEGDPTTFNMTIQVLRPANGEMIKFVQYEIGA